MASRAEPRHRRFPWRIVGWGGAGLLLILPLLIGAPWTGSDYVFAGIVFGAIGGCLELTLRKRSSRRHRAGVVGALATAFLLVWINAAVGIIGDEDNPANFMYLAVVGAMVVGGIVAGGSSRHMARSMSVAGCIQLFITAVALVCGLGAHEPPGVAGIAVLNLFFVGLCAVSAWLFRTASSVE